jgi:hypothetical protein
MNPFDRLGLPPQLALNEDELARAVSDQSARNHPDSGGCESAFQEIRKAGDHLKVPALRIKAALAVLNWNEGERGRVPDEIMDLFSPVAAVLAEVEDFLVARRKAVSGLGKAVLDAGLPALKTRLEDQIQSVSTLEDRLISRFPEFDAIGWENCLAEMSEVARGLAFLRKWLGRLREANGKLFEALLGG